MIECSKIKCMKYSKGPFRCLSTPTLHTQREQFPLLRMPDFGFARLVPYMLGALHLASATARTSAPGLQRSKVLPRSSS